ncbi:MAG: glutamate-1-semialdehyde 2,1-aminomutase [Defluviitaleaceae bacterium]|nr:glutamate-1-semialdehyde 2,1-aminomutase [Defluviitaleaceae bacterium]
MKREMSSRAYKAAQNYIPGGVNSPVRAFRSVGLDPIFVESGRGSRIFDIDGNGYIDYVCSWGPLILGHSHDDLVGKVTETARKGLSFGLSTQAEVEMARIIVESYIVDSKPAIDLVRMVNSGTEATMSALRAARAYTRRDKILKFEGCYHGHSDAMLVKSGSGALTYGVPTSLGVPEDVIKHTLVGRYNDCEQLREIFKAHGHEIAAVIVEPVVGNVGVISAGHEFLRAMRELCTEHGSVLIFDEVITGFRLSYNSAAGYFGIAPDMACFGKIIGGGLPVGAYGGKADIMKTVSPLGGAYQAGTLSGNPLAMHVGMKQLQILRDNPEIYGRLDSMGSRLANGLRQAVSDLGLDYTVNQVGSLVCLFFAGGSITDYDGVMRCDVPRFNKYFKLMLDRGILLAPTQFEAMFISAAHTDADIEYTLECCRESLREVSRDEG